MSTVRAAGLAIRLRPIAARWRAWSPSSGGSRAGAIIVASLLVAAASLLLPFGLKTDQWAWLIWGREVGNLALDTTGGPNWKPLPVLFTTVLAPLGDLAPPLWLVISRAAWVLALIAAYRIANRLAGRFAGVLAVLGVSLITDPALEWVRWFTQGGSETLAVATVLWAVDRHMCARREQALALLFAASLARPEAWPLLGFYAGVVWVSRPRARLLAGLAVVAIPVLWFGGDFWGSNSVLTGSARARGGFEAAPVVGPDDRVARTLTAAGGLVTPAMWLAALYAAVSSLRRWGGTPFPGGREGAPILLAIVAAAWIAVDIELSDKGYPGFLARFMAPAAALVAVLSAVGFVQVVRAVPRQRPRILAAIAVGAASLGWAGQRLAALPERWDRERRDVDSVKLLADALESGRVRQSLGACGNRVFVLGKAAADGGAATKTAWELGLPMREVTPILRRDFSPAWTAVVLTGPRRREVIEGKAPKGTQLPVQPVSARQITPGGPWTAYAVNCRIVPAQR